MNSYSPNPHDDDELTPHDLRFGYLDQRASDMSASKSTSTALSTSDQPGGESSLPLSGSDKRIADMQWLHALLDQVHQGGSAERRERKEAAIAATLRTIRSASEDATTPTAEFAAPTSDLQEKNECRPDIVARGSSPTTATSTAEPASIDKSRHRRHWLGATIFAAVTAAAASFAAFSLLWGPRETPVNADVLMEEVKAEAEKPIDRTYAVEIISASPNRPTIQGTLDVRGGTCFVFDHPAPLGRAKIGSDGRDFWFVPAVGPVLVRQDSTLLESWINRTGAPLPILQVTAVLERMSDHYELTRLPNEPSSDDKPPVRRIRGRRVSGPLALPDEIEIWTNERTSVVERITLHWNDGPAKEITFTLSGETPRADNWYQHRSHHAPHRPVLGGAGR